MSFNPSGFVFPKSNIPEGGAGYTSNGEVILQPTEFEFEYLADVGGYAIRDIRPAFRLVAGQSYKVVWNGVEYICAAISFRVVDMRIVAVGNAGPLNMGMLDTGEPFLLMYTENSSDDEFNDVFSGEPTATVSVIEGTVHTIDPKYLPTKVIDLAPSGIGQAIMGLFAQGGGTTTLEDVGDFWEQVDGNCGAGSTVLLDFNGSPIEVGGVTRCFDKYRGCFEVCASCLFKHDGSIYSGAFIIYDNESRGTEIHLKVETL